MFQASYQEPGDFSKRSGRVLLRFSGIATVLAALAGCGGGLFDGFSISPSTANAPPNFTRGMVVLNAPEPVYPLRARSLGVEGWVMLAFTVDESGSVALNTIDTIDQQPPGYFESAAINAARRMNFENTLERPVEDVRFVFRFELEDRDRFLIEPRQQENIGFREYLPASFVTPDYPEFAREQELEGHVLVGFTITATGSVRDVVVIESNPPSIFDEEALRAAARLRYQPRLIDNEPVSVEGVTYRFNWNLPPD